MNVAKKKRKSLCQCVGCSNKSYYHIMNNKKIFKKFCTKHLRQRQKEINPLRYTYDLLKQNAKRRKKEFLLSFEEFKMFCEKTDYLNLKGRFKDSCTIDRINQNEGYHKDNIQIMTNSMNVRKYHFDNNFFEKHGYLPANR